MKQWTEESSQTSSGVPNPFVSLFRMKVQKNGFRKNDVVLIINLLWKVKG